MPKPLFTDNEWTFARIEATTEAIERIAAEALRLDPYPNRIEVISA